MNDRIVLFDELHEKFPAENYPLLPLSNAVKNNLFGGIFEGGKGRATRKNKKNNGKKRKKSIREKKFNHFQ